MTVTVADTRTTPDEADSTTGWTGTATPQLITTDPAPVELTGCIGMAVGTTTDDLYFTITSADLTDTLVYVWVLGNGAMDTLVNGGIALQLNDGTNGIGYHLAGSDAAAFRHADGPVGWQCLVLDTSVLPVNATAYTGAVANLTLTAITGIGSGFKTLSKALGGSANCFTDVIRYGNDGLIITTGTLALPGTFDEIAIEDRSDVTTQAYGILRELGAGLYGCQGPLTFGDTVGTVATYFYDTSTTMTFEDRGLGLTKYYMDVVGNATGSTTFKLGDKTGTTGGSNGCTISCPAGVGASFTASDIDLQFLLLYGSSFSGFENGMVFSSDATNAPNHEIFACTFSGNGQIEPGLTLFKNNSISTSTDATGSLLLPSSTTGMADLSFVSDGTGHAILITTPGTYTFTNYTYSGFGATTTTDAVVYNNSAGAVTINVVGGDVPTYLNGASATTTVVASFDLTLTNIPTGVKVTIVNSSTRVELQHTVSTGVDIIYTHGGGETVDILLNSLAYDPNLSDVYSLTLDTADQAIKFQMLDDLNYENP